MKSLQATIIELKAERTALQKAYFVMEGQESVLFDIEFNRTSSYEVFNQSELLEAINVLMRQLRRRMTIVSKSIADIIADLWRMDNAGN